MDDLSGVWLYRSFLNTDRPVGGDRDSALALIFAEGSLSLHAPEPGELVGGLAFGEEFRMHLRGSIAQDSSFALAGYGMEGTATDGWRYDYRGILAHRWRDAVDQVDALVGTVLRSAAHGPGAPAGVTASFIAVRDARSPAAREGVRVPNFFA